MASRLARYSWLPGGLAAAVVIAIGRLIAPSSFASLEYAGYDHAQRAASPPSTQDIVLVDIDAQSLGELGAWPWPRSVHAEFLNRLQAAGARLVAFTVVPGVPPTAKETERLQAALALLESSDLGNSEQAGKLRALLRAADRDPDVQLTDAINAYGNVVMPVDVRIADVDEESTDIAGHSPLTPSASALAAAPAVIVTRQPAPKLVQAAQALGHTFLPEDRDGVIRTDLVAVKAGPALLPSLAAAIAARALPADTDRVAYISANTLRIGNQTIPLDGMRSRPHYFAETAARFTHYPYSQILGGAVPANELRDKIVLVGAPEPDNTLMTAAGNRTNAQTAIASSVASLMQGTVYSHPTSAVVTEWLTALGVILFAALLLPVAGPGLGALATALLASILAIADVGLLSSTQTWVQLMVPAIAAVAGFVLYVLSEFIRRANTRTSGAKDPTANLRSLGQTFQRQGQLDLAFETYRRCPLDAPTMELLYYLGMDFEKRRQNQKAAAVYGHIATRDPNYRDLRARRARVAEQSAATREAVAEKPKARMPVPAPKYEKPREDWDTESQEESEPASLGRKLGRYTLERELGKGAMGVVYLGRDPHINRVVAIKAIPLADEFEEHDLEEARARFFREAEMAGRLNHPAIVTVYDAGEDQGLAYIAMEYLRGQHLSHYTDASRLLRPGTVMTLVARTAEALHYAHRQNVVHRDIKPANIMFNLETDELKITDFGIARLTDTSRTKTGIVLGTPSFMSPEQLEGRSLDGRSDQFALGVSLYQLLTGQLPFRAESMPRLMQKIATEPHPPIRTLRPELPEAIEAIVSRALAKNADDRYPTCGEMAVDLRACAQILEPRKAATEHEWLLP